MLKFLKKITNIPEEICLNKENKEVSNLNIQKNKIPNKINSFLELKNFIKDLNKIKVYLLVTNPKHNKLNKKILLLLQPEDRFKSEQTLVNLNYRSILVYVSRKYIKIRIRKKSFIYPILQGRQRYSIRYLTTKSSEDNFTLNKFRNAKSYYFNNLGGYKSICPVFFDKISAESFLINALKKNQKIYGGLSTSSLKKSEQYFKSILNTKIVTIGLGDFIDYYSSEPNKELLKKVEFLFFPSLDQKKSSINYLENKDFKFYYNKYCLLKYK